MEIHAILTETLACFLPGGAKDLSALLYVNGRSVWIETATHWNPIRQALPPLRLCYRTAVFLCAFIPKDN